MATVADVVIRYASVGDEVALHETTVPAAVNLVSLQQEGDAVLDPRHAPQAPEGLTRTFGVHVGGGC